MSGRSSNFARRRITRSRSRDWRGVRRSGIGPCRTRRRRRRKPRRRSCARSSRRSSKPRQRPVRWKSAPSFIEEKIAPDDGFRKPVDTSRDDEPEAEGEEKDDWDKLTAAEEDELPTFFEAIKPHMRRNQRGPGMSVGVDYLAKKWDQ